MTLDIASYFAIVATLVLSLKFCLTLTNLIDCVAAISKRYNGLTIDYGEYFKLTVNFYFDHGRSPEYRL